jgi:hypothetical protein
MSFVIYPASNLHISYLSEGIFIDFSQMYLLTYSKN